MTNSDGYITLMAVLLATVVGVSLITTMLTTSVSNTQTTIVHEYAHHARALADACIEAGLEELRVDVGFTGSGTLSIGQGFCEYTVSDAGLDTEVIASSTVSGVVRRVRVVLDDLTPTPSVLSWEEVATF